MTVTRVLCNGGSWPKRIVSTTSENNGSRDRYNNVLTTFSDCCLGYHGFPLDFCRIRRVLLQSTSNVLASLFEFIIDEILYS